MKDHEHRLMCLRLDLVRLIEFSELMLYMCSGFILVVMLTARGEKYRVGNCGEVTALNKLTTLASARQMLKQSVM